MPSVFTLSGAGDEPGMVRVKIDGVETVLRYDSYSGNRGHQYLTPGNRSSHAFNARLEQLPKGSKIRTNGSTYELLQGAPMTRRSNASVKRQNETVERLRQAGHVSMKTARQLHSSSVTPNIAFEAFRPVARTDASWYGGKSPPYSKAKRKKAKTLAGQSMVDAIHARCRVTIVDRFGKERTGRAVMKGPFGWVLNMGGRHGTPAIATDDNTVKVSCSRKKRQ